MKRLLVILWMFSYFGLCSQQIVEAEYYFDVDPGFGLGTPISITANQDISDLTVSVDVSGISEGIHNLIVRAKDDFGSWSMTHKQIILKTQLPSSSPVSTMEYYFDNDPGEGNGTSISFTPDVDVVDHMALISTAGVSEGIHTLNVRSKNSDESWSHVASRAIFVSAPLSIKDVVTLEYFVGTDPGFGNGTEISIAANSDIADLSATIPIEDLEFGINQLSIRSMDAAGYWSHNTTKSILKMKAPNLPNIVEMEYFFNNDPGLGNGTFVSYAPNPDWTDLSVLINTSSLDDGFHVLYIRSKDSNGIWSLSNSMAIQKTTIDELSDITMLEYYFDIDPGLGLGTAISITPDGEIDNQVTTISVAGLSKGVHTLFVRSKNALGEWSHAYTKSILIANSNTIKDITAMEYFFDSDPGFGQGTPISIGDMPDISDLNSVISLAGLSKGIHHLFVRSKDSNGQWSHAYESVFLNRSPDVEEDIEKIEYFIGADPGLGNGTEITIPGFAAAPDLIDLEHLLDINSLDEGVQRMSIRSKDDSGVWSHTHTQPIYVYKNVNADMVKAEYFIDTDPGYGQATQVTFSPELDKSNHIFPIDISGLDYGVYRLHTRYMSANNKWSMDEITPFLIRDGELYEMIEGEYFIDVDPGPGMAVPFSFTADVDVPDISILILTAGIDAGDHDLYIRTKNSNGEWSLTNVKFDIEIESTLPLKILSFEVRKVREEALLEWKVVEAVNTSHFEIERTSSTDFEYLGRVESINKLTEIEYQFTDTDPFDGVNYYRLRQVDLDGNYQYSPIRSVNFGAENNIVVYPNPSIDELRVDGSLKDDATFLIYDSTNKLVKQGELSANKSIDMSDLISGSYHFVLRNGRDSSSFLVIKI